MQDARTKWELGSYREDAASSADCGTPDPRSDTSGRSGLRLAGGLLEDLRVGMSGFHDPRAVRCEQAPYMSRAG